MTDPFPTRPDGLADGAQLEWDALSYLVPASPGVPPHGRLRYLPEPLPPLPRGGLAPAPPRPADPDPIGTYDDAVARAPGAAFPWLRGRLTFPTSTRSTT